MKLEISNLRREKSIEDCLDCDIKENDVTATKITYLSRFAN